MKKLPSTFKLLPIGLFFIFSSQVLAKSAIERKVDSLNDLSFQLQTSDRNHSIMMAREALRLCPNNYKDGLMNARLNIGMNYTTLNQIDSSLYYLNTIAPYFEEDAFKSGLVSYYLGIAYSFLRDFKKSEGLLNKASELFSQSESSEYIAEVQNSHGIIQARQGNNNKALAYFLEAYEIKLTNNLKCDKELTNIAIVYRTLKDYQKALMFANKSLTICKAAKDSLGIVQTLVTIGNIYSSSQKFDSAIFIYDQAYALASMRGYRMQTFSILQNKSVATERSGQLNEAMAMLKQVIGISKEEDHVWEKAFYELARIQKKQGYIDSSIFFAKKSYVLSTKYHDPGIASIGAKLLSDNYRQVQQLDSALVYLDHFIMHEDTLTKRTNQSRLSDIRVQIETLEQENEINKLNQEKKLAELRRNWLIAAIIATIIIGLLLVILLIYKNRNKLRINQLKQEKLRGEVQRAQGELQQQTLHMIHLNNCLDNIEEQIKKARGKNYANNDDLSQVLTSIQLNKSLDKDWENFNKYFSKVHATFVEKFPGEKFDLSNHEQRVCALLRSGLSNREIATILNIQPKSVVMLRYRIKKKLHLEKEQDLEDYLNRL